MMNVGASQKFGIVEGVTQTVSAAEGHNVIGALLQYDGASAPEVGSVK
jgi:hypothetical protein